RLGRIAGIEIGIPLLSGALGVLQRYLSASIGEGIIFHLRCALFEHLQRMSIRFFTNTRTGEIMSRLNSDVVGAQHAFTGTLPNLIANCFTLATTLAVMLTLEWRLTLASIAILPLFVLPVRRVARLLRDLTREQMTYNGQMNALMNETLNVSGALLVKIFGRAPDENARFRQRAARVRDAGVRVALVGRWFFIGLGLVSAVGTAVVFWLGGWLVLQGTFTLGTVVAFGAYLTQLYGPLATLANARVELTTSLVSFERVFEVLDLPVEIGDRPGAIPLRHVEGRIAFEDVSFSYQALPGATVAALTPVKRWPDEDTVEIVSRAERSDGTPRDGRAAARDGAATPNGADDGLATSDTGPRWALRHVSFTVEPGQIAALVGPSGAGKTTVTNLLLRLYDPTSGCVRVDGHDLRDITLDSLTRHVGVVTQETYLFHDTIRANLLYAKPDASQEELEEACRAANIHDVIVRLPEGYDTVVGERGYRLSGGEKQRIAIARVILKNPRILVLDEATAHLDSQSEALIQAALANVMQGRTSLVIAHRLSTILAADVILVLDEGRLVEQGTHAELLARGGLYASLFETQFGAAREHR
ncbi:MAG TPA: ABC transporter ATP-binding protein, partial [Chloroflexota bacterium]